MLAGCYNLQTDGASYLPIGNDYFIIMIRDSKSTLWMAENGILKKYIIYKKMNNILFCVFFNYEKTTRIINGKE